ncbi:MAG: hypothetical protein ABR924_02685 [Terracidiphilus sp.]|jgi:hypothetical protein
MTKELKEHLIRCENAMQSAKPILGKYEFPIDPRTLTVIGYISMLMEHQESIVILECYGKPGSASALFRPVVESAYRALWINLPATDAEIERFNKNDTIDLKFGEIAKALDDAYDQEGKDDFFQDFKTQAWEHLNSYTHGGMHQIGRRFVKHEVVNNYSAEEIYETTTSVTTIVLLVISLFLRRHGHLDSANQIFALIETYGRLADGTKPADK